MASTPPFLPIFVFFDSVRALAVYSLIRSGIALPAAQISLASELFKLGCALLFHLRWLKKHGRAQEPFLLSLVPKHAPSDLSTGLDARFNCRMVLQTAIPAAMYLFNNLLYLLALKYTSPALLGIALLAKLPCTAVLHYLAFGRARTSKAWLSLVVLCVGLLGLHLPWQSIATYFSSDDGFSPSLASLKIDGLQDTAWIGSALGLTIALTSGFTSVITESLMKQDIPFWTVQIWLYLYGSIFASIAYGLGFDQLSSSTSTALVQLPTSHLVGKAFVVAITACTGIVVANILRKADNLVKLVGSSATVVTTLVLQPVLYPDLLKQTFNPGTVLALGAIVLSTWTYNYHKDDRPSSPRIKLPPTPLAEKDLQLPGSEAAPENLSTSAEWTRPTLGKLACFSVLFFLLAYAAPC